MPIPNEVFGLQIDPAALEEQLGLAANLPITTSPGEGVVKSLGVRMPYSGKSILDVASGCSTTSAWLRRAGADTTAVDIGYSDIDDMAARAHRFIETDIMFRVLQAGMPELAVELSKELDVFLDDASTNRGRYVPGSVTALPFKDESFDEVLCSSLLTEGTIGQQRELVFVGLSEMLRVTRRGGVLRLGMLLGGQSRNQDVLQARAEIKNNMSDFGMAAKQAKIVRKAGIYVTRMQGLEQAEYFTFEKR